MKLRLGCFEKFKGFDKVLLISGDRAGLRELADSLRRLENAGSTPLEVHSLPCIRRFQGVSLTAYPIDRELGVRQVALSESAPRFSWRHSKEGWSEAAEKIEVVAEDDRGGHAYLTGLCIEDAIVMVSQGEYDEAWWDRYGT